ncbi:MAG: DNA polymerase III subunit delta [Leptolyngbyaceae cyanobacterium bins.302]|nr:DNA polymerase III subunit delta [Leptolyngbyaceae cyanobacterium bins.302]
MPTLLLIGDDSYRIHQEIHELKQQLNPTWSGFNYHRYGADDLSDAIATARTPPLADDQRLVIVENCQFNQFGEQQLNLLQVLPQLPSSTTLIFTGRSLDKRLKISKHLLKHSTIQSLELISPWRTDLIEAEIKTRAKSTGLQLSHDCIQYLAAAIGNDLAGMDAELEKLTLYANGQPSSLAAVKSLVPNTTHSSLQLAEAIRQGDTAQTVQRLHSLLSRAEVPLVILSTLLTQFRTWLWVKCALSDKTRRKDSEIAQLCGVGNPKRLYYLRQEVAKTSVSSLTQTLTRLFELEVTLKQGANPDVMLPTLVGIARSFRSAI